MRKRLYKAIAYDGWDMPPLYFVAKTSREAHSMAFGCEDFDEVPFIEVHIKWLKGENVDDFEYGAFSPYESLKRGFYPYVGMLICEGCEQEECDLAYDKNTDKCLCEDCFEDHPQNHL